MEPSDWNFSFPGETVVEFWQQQQQHHWFDALEQTN
jgi:hypothetical protein